MRVLPQYPPGAAKTEAWYISHASTSRNLIGQLSGAKPDDVKAGSRTRRKPEKMDVRGVSAPGDIYLVEAGTMHAIEAGFLILEVQQPSDTAFVSTTGGDLTPRASLVT